MNIFKALFFSLICMHLSPLKADESQQTVKIVKGSEIQEYEPLIVKLRMEELSKFPYLIWNGEAFEKEYAATYAQSKSGAVAFAYKNEKIIGVLTGVSLKEYDTGLGLYGAPLIADQLQGMKDVDSIYHLGEIIALEQDWEQPITKLFGALESYAQTLGFKAVSFITIVREPGHPQTPSNFQDDESALLKKLGYEKTGRTITYQWPTVQADGSTPNLDNTCEIWLKKL